jgi:nucleoside-diphosphate-sugar epimerase
MIVALLGATSKTGRYVTQELCARGHTVRALGRDLARLATLDARAAKLVVDLAQPTALPDALAGVDVVASLAHARFTQTVLDAVPPAARLVLTGSLRKHTRLADPAAEAVRAGEALFLATRRAGVMLHPSMIYGAPEERNVGRILRFLRRWPASLPVPVPLPDGGRHTVQPVFVDDMVAAFVAAVETPQADGASITVAGPTPITYRAMVETCARAVGRRIVVLPVPVAALSRAAAFAQNCGIRVPFNAAELTRASEDKAFAIDDMVTRLGVMPRSFADGVRLKLERGWV